jgi:hypothetical protein
VPPAGLAQQLLHRPRPLAPSPGGSRGVHGRRSATRPRAPGRRSKVQTGRPRCIMEVMEAAAEHPKRRKRRGGGGEKDGRGVGKKTAGGSEGGGSLTGWRQSQRPWAPPRISTVPRGHRGDGARAQSAKGRLRRPELDPPYVARPLLLRRPFPLLHRARTEIFAAATEPRSAHPDLAGRFGRRVAAPSAG